MSKKKLQEIVWDNDSFKIKGTSKTVFPFAIGGTCVVSRDQLKGKNSYSAIKKLAIEDNLLKRMLSYYSVSPIPRTQKVAINFYREGNDFMEQAAVDASRRSSQHNY